MACVFWVTAMAAAAPTAAAPAARTGFHFMPRVYRHGAHKSSLRYFSDMDLIPKPDQVVSAAGNVAHKMLYGGVADLRKMPRTLIDEGMLRQVYPYRPVGHTKTTGEPVTLVTPLPAPSICFPLPPGRSLGGNP